MDGETWADCYERLLSAYRKAADVEQQQVYFDALRQVPGPIIRLAVQAAIREEKFWPSVATLREHCTTAGKAIEARPSLCDRCGGNQWIEAEPFTEHGVRYTNVVRRCPQCRPAQERVA